MSFASLFDNVNMIKTMPYVAWNNVISNNGGGSGGSGVNQITSPNGSIGINTPTGDVEIAVNPELTLNTLVVSGNLTNGTSIIPQASSGNNGKYLGCSGGEYAWGNPSSGGSTIVTEGSNITVTGPGIDFTYNVALDASLTNLTSVATTDLKIGTSGNFPHASANTTSQVLGSDGTNYIWQNAGAGTTISDGVNTTVNAGVDATYKIDLNANLTGINDITTSQITTGALLFQVGESTQQFPLPVLANVGQVLGAENIGGTPVLSWIDNPAGIQALTQGANVTITETTPGDSTNLTVALNSSISNLTNVSSEGLTVANGTYTINYPNAADTFSATQGDVLTITAPTGNTINLGWAPSGSSGGGVTQITNQGTDNINVTNAGIGNVQLSLNNNLTLSGGDITIQSAQLTQTQATITAPIIVVSSEFTTDTMTQQDPLGNKIFYPKPENPQNNSVGAYVGIFESVVPPGKSFTETTLDFFDIIGTANQISVTSTPIADGSTTAIALTNPLNIGTLSNPSTATANIATANIDLLAVNDSVNIYALPLASSTIQNASVGQSLTIKEKYAPGDVGNPYPTEYSAVLDWETVGGGGSTYTGTSGQVAVNSGTNVISFDDSATTLLVNNLNLEMTNAQSNIQGVYFLSNGDSNTGTSLNEAMDVYVNYDATAQTWGGEVYLDNTGVGIYTNSAAKEWKFDNTGAITFPDSTVQTTAYTGGGGGGGVTDITNDLVTAPISSDQILTTANTGSVKLTLNNNIALGVNPLTSPGSSLLQVNELQTPNLQVTDGSLFINYPSTTNTVNSANINKVLIIEDIDGTNTTATLGWSAYTSPQSATEAVQFFAVQDYGVLIAPFTFEIPITMTRFNESVTMTIGTGSVDMDFTASTIANNWAQTLGPTYDGFSALCDLVGFGGLDVPTLLGNVNVYNDTGSVYYVGFWCYLKTLYVQLYDSAIPNNNTPLIAFANQKYRTGQKLSWFDGTTVYKATDISFTFTASPPTSGPKEIIFYKYA